MKVGRKRHLHLLWVDEGGQATTEYLLMLLIAITLAISVIKKFLQPTLARLGEILSARIEAGLFGRGGDFHHLRIGQ